MLDDDANLLAGLEAEGEKQEVLTLAEIVALAEKMSEAVAQVDRLEAKLKTAKAALRSLEIDQLPAAMKGAGLKLFALDDGRQVTIEEDLKVSVPAKRKGEIIERLRTLGAGDMIKNVLTIRLDKGDDNKVPAVVAVANEVGLGVERSEDVSTATLKAWLRARLAEKKEVDLGFYGAFNLMKATIRE